LAARGTEDWSAAEKIHGISRRHLLEFGHAADDVAHWLNTVCRCKTVLSDNPAHDATWLRQLHRSTAVGQELDLVDAVDATAGLWVSSSRRRKSLWSEFAGATRIVIERSRMCDRAPPNSSCAAASSARDRGHDLDQSGGDPINLAD